MWLIIGLFAFFALGGLATYLKEREKEDLQKRSTEALETLARRART